LHPAAASWNRADRAREDQVSQRYFENPVACSSVTGNKPPVHKQNLLATMQAYHSKALGLIGKLHEAVEEEAGTADPELTRITGGVLSALLTSEAELRSLIEELAAQIEEDAEVAARQSA
jgi:hypothetical protein